MRMDKINMSTSMRLWLSSVREPQVNTRFLGGSRMGKPPDRCFERRIQATSGRACTAVNGEVREYAISLPAHTAHF